MLDLDYQIIKENSFKTICHVGSYDGAEVELYHETNVSKVIWVEANYNILNKLIKNTINYNIENVYLPLTLSDEDDSVVDFKITTNGESSSFMDLGDLHKSTYPEIEVIEKITTITKRFDTFVKTQSDFDWNEVEMLVLDCQGADLKVLKGFGILLDSPKLKVIKCEVNFGDMYVDAPTEQDIDDYLRTYGFTKSYWFVVEDGTWGDTFWVKY